MFFRYLIVPFILLFFSVTQLSAESPFQGDKRPARSIRITQNIVAELIPGRNLELPEIVVSSNASKMTFFAAAELQKLLNLKLGAKVPIVHSPTDNNVSFILGINQFSKSAGIDDSTLCRDAFIIKTSGKKIYILGRDDPEYDESAAVKRVNGWQFNYEKGTLFGIYDFMERFADVRFFFTGAGTLVPQGNLRIPGIDIYDRPDYEVRQVQIYEGTYFDAQNGTYERNMDYLRMRFQTQYIPCCHGLANIGYFQRFGKTHPEYFAMDKDGARVTSKRDGIWHSHFCYTGNVKEEIFQDAKSCLLNEPASKRGIIALNGKIGWDPTGQKPGSVFCAMPGDSFLRCECEKCRPFMKDERTISDFYWGFVFDLAERLQKEGIPGIVTNMSYPPYSLIPRDRKMPSNVFVMAATRGPWNVRYPEIQKKDTDRCRKWIEYGGKKIWLWNYANKFADSSFPGIPHSTPMSIGKYYQNMAPLIYGAFLESETDYYQFNLLNYYIFGKIAWNNKTDVNVLLQDYYQHMFGPASVPLKKFFDRIEYLWINRILKEPLVTDLGPASVTASTHECWTEIYSKAERSALRKLFDEAETLAGKNYDALGRVKLFRKLFLDVILRHGEIYDRQTDTIPQFTVNAELLNDGESITIDGILNEPVWKKSGIYLQNISGQNTDLSRVAVAADAKNIYFAFDFDEPEMAKVSASEYRADSTNIWKDNGIEIFLNPDCSRKNYLQIILNSAGSIRIQQWKRTGVTIESVSPRNVSMQTKVLSDEKSWKGEIAIPLAELGIGKQDKIVANFTRHQVRKNMPDQYYSWSPFLNKKLISIFHDADNFGTLSFGRILNRNIVKDGDFADRKQYGRKFGGWWASPPQKTTRVSYDNNSFISGFRSICLESEGETISLRQELPELKPDTKYKISFFIRLENVKQKKPFAGAVLNVMDDRNRWFPQKWLMGTFPWTYQETFFTSGPKTNQEKKRSYMLLYLMNASGKVWFDQIKLEEIKP